MRLSPNQLLARLTLAAVVAVTLAGPRPSDLDEARAIDRQISKLTDLSPQSRSEAIKALAPRIIQLPPRYSVPLATNLAIDGVGDTNSEGLEIITSTLVKALLKLPPAEINLGAGGFQNLAELNLYAHMRGSLNDPRYMAAVAKLRADDLHRNESDFKLRDLPGTQWSLKNLRGRVVLLHFWATWCPPCRTEIPDLNLVAQRFRNQGLVVLGVSEEDELTLRRFVSQNSLRFPVLLDRGGETERQFLVPGFPQSYVFDREGYLVAESIYQTGLEGFLDMLAQAGLR